MHLSSRLTLLGLIASSPLAAQRVPDIQVSNGAAATAPVMAVSGSAIYVAWEDWRDGRRDIFFNRSIDGGATWLPEDVRIENDPPGLSDSTFPRIAADGSTVYVVWQERRNFVDPGKLSPGYDPDVFFNRSTDGGLTWLPQDVRLDSGVPFTLVVDAEPRMAASGSNVYVVWEDPQSWATPSIYFNASSDGGNTWLGPARIDNQSTSIGNTNPRLAADGSDVYVAWEFNSPSDILFNRSTDGGATWLPADIRLDSGPANSGWSLFPVLALEGSSLYAAWIDTRSGTTEIFFNRSLTNGTTWLASDFSIPGSATSTNPFLATSEASVYATWQSTRGGSTHLYFNRSLDNGSNWLPSPVRLDTGTPAGSGRANSPAIAAHDANVYVVWGDRRNGQEDIYFNRSADRGTTWLPAPIRLDTGSPPGATASGAPQIALAGGEPYTIWAGSEIRFNIPFGFLPFGSGTAGAGGITPQLDGSGTALPGNAPRLEVTSAVGGASAVLLVGREGTSPLEGALVRPSLTSPLLLLGAAGVPGAGSLSVPVPIPAVAPSGDAAPTSPTPHPSIDSALLPSAPFLSGTNLFLQVLVLDPAAPGSYSLTNALELWIG